MALDEASVCRFCFSSSDPLIDIFDESETNVLEIITEHIGEVNRSDTLPKCTCTKCWRKIEEFHDFHRSILTAQEDYLKRMIKSETEPELKPNRGSHETTRPPDFVEVITNFDEYNVFANGTIKACNELDNDDDGNKQHEIKLEVSNDFCNVTAPAPDDEMDVSGENEESNDEKCNDDYDYKKEEEEEEIDQDGADSECVSTTSKFNDQLDPATRKRIFAENFDTTCDICSVDMRSMKGAISHYKDEHDIEKGYIKCCGLKLKRDKFVDDHIRWHINPEIFKCSFCDRNMKTRFSLSGHVSAHRNPKTYICDICGRIFPQIDKIKDHMITHTKTVLCPICRKAFYDQKALDSHSKFNHKPEEVNKQIKQTTQMKKTKIDAVKMEAVIAKHFNMKCDHCDNILKSLQEAQFHYMHDHQIANGYIQCCDLKIKKTIDIEGHVLYHLRPELFVCCICQKQYTTVDKLQIHLRLHKRTKRRRYTYICKICNKSYTEKSNLRAHSEKVHGIVLPMEKRNSNGVADPTRMKALFDMHCDVCKTELSSLQHAKLHYLEEHNIPVSYIKCCGFKFTDFRNINDHLQYHTNPSIYTCEICSRTFQRKKDLGAHMSNHKTVAAKKFSCDECGKVWRSQYNLDLHKISHQDMATRAVEVCKYCDKKLTSTKSLKNHILFVHKKDTKADHMCEFCGKQFLKRLSVINHIQTVHQAEDASINHNEPVQHLQCTMCSASFVNKHRLKKHIQDIHEGVPVQCPQCDKISPNQHALDRHMNRVHVANSHQCHLCPKSFKAAVALKDHIATHTGEKTYKCSFCPEAFIWRPNMYAHQKKAHPDEWKATKSQNPRTRRYLRQ